MMRDYILFALALVVLVLLLTACAGIPQQDTGCRTSQQGRDCADSRESVAAPGAATVAAPAVTAPAPAPAPAQTPQRNFARP